VIVGISTDTVQLQQKFTEKEKLTFPLYCDTEGKVSKAFGVLNPKNNLSKRATFIINKDGNIAKIYASVAKASDHPEEILQWVKSNLKK
jgi:peroxiredoxin Q/BCP